LRSEKHLAKYITIVYAEKYLDKLADPSNHIPIFGGLRYGLTKSYRQRDLKSSICFCDISDILVTDLW
jgi:hypothetical protein